VKVARTLVSLAALLGLPAALSAPAAAAPAGTFEHIVVVVQENRTPDNLFQGLCTARKACRVRPGPGQYNIQTANWLDKAAPGGVVQPHIVFLAGHYDMGHSHQAFTAMCDPAPDTAACRMDGAAGIGCRGTICPPNAPFAYVDNSTGILAPYLALATQYGWANYMFQTNQGPSLPAHQYLFGGTSAPSATDDRKGIFVSENGNKDLAWAGCAAAAAARVPLINAYGVEPAHDKIFPCFEHQTVPDLLSPMGFSWRYYTPGQDSIWTAPNAIKHICVPSTQTSYIKCTGAQWTANVDLVPADVLSDIAHCNLRNASWVIPTGQNSDHADGNKGGGPSWVASIVNAIGNSACKDGRRSYWNDTAIVIVWDDWGGWYDHEPPRFLPFPQGGYQLGFRVPMIVVSAYTPAGYIDNGRHDFGSIIRFIEHNFAIREGKLNFADARATTDLLTFFHFRQGARPFQTIPAPLDADFFLNDKSPALPPDDD